MCLLESIGGAVMAQWIRPQTLTQEILSSNPLATLVSPLCETLYPHFFSPLLKLKCVGPLATYEQALDI